MLLRLLLWFAALRMSWLSTRDAAFKELISGKKGALQVITADKKLARYYFFNNGAFMSAGGLTDEPHVTMTFESAAFGFQLFLQMRKNTAAVMEAVQQQKLFIEGDMQFALWFISVAKYVFKGEENE